MKKFIMAAATAALFVTACGTVPAEWSDGSASASAEPMKLAEMQDPNRKVCKKTRVSGSQFDKKVCHTVGEWAKMEEAAKVGADEFQRRSAGNIRSPQSGQ